MICTLTGVMKLTQNNFIVASFPSYVPQICFLYFVMNLMSEPNFSIYGYDSCVCYANHLFKIYL